VIYRSNTWALIGFEKDELRIGNEPHGFQSVSFVLFLQKTTQMSVIYRPMAFEDISQVNMIYNHAITLGYSTAHTEPLPLSYHETWWNEHLEEGNPILIACEGNRVLGWNSLSFYRSGRHALSKVRESSYYIHKDHWNKGIASQLMQRTIEKAKLLGIGTLVTFIMDANEASVHLMKKFHFELWGRLPGVLDVPGGPYDHLIFGKKI
jgi:L-amino acid N-acyltransferase YncA